MEKYQELEKRIERLEKVFSQYISKDRKLSGLKQTKKTKEQKKSQQLENKANKLEEGVEEFKKKIPKKLWDSSSIISKLGIALLLIGIALLFKYSIENSLLTPWVRIGFGIIAGLSLIGIGHKIFYTKKNLSQVLIGGGIAALYISFFSGYQIFHYFNYIYTFSFLLILSLYSGFISIKQNNPILSIIGLLGGLAVPLILDTEISSVAGLYGYTSFILIAAALIFYYKKWNSLLTASLFGGIFTICLIHFNKFAFTRDKVIFQINLIVFYFTNWFIPLITQLKNPKKSLEVILNFFTPIIPVSIILWSQYTWKLSDVQIGYIFLGLSLIYTAASFKIKKDLSLKKIFLGAAFILFTAAILEFFDGEIRFLVLALEASLIIYLKEDYQNRFLFILKYLFFFFIQMWLLFRIADHNSYAAIFYNKESLINLLVIVSSYAGLSKNKKLRFFPLIWLLFSFFFWTYMELYTYENGQAYISIIGGFISLSIFVFSLLKYKKRLNQIGLVMISIVVLKLFFVDFSALEAIWRILLFISFGIVLLVISFVSKHILEKRRL